MCKCNAQHICRQCLDNAFADAFADIIVCSEQIINEDLDADIDDAELLAEVDYSDDQHYYEINSLGY